ncbi:MAG: hypothetical protein Q8J76_02135, partial [Desulfobulbaceae bacterium]|nr:hypothetical protein [Desulfobulbaceae bacterium]
AFVVNHNWPEKGELVDISKGGFSFQYVSDTPWPDSSGGGFMVFGNHDSIIANVSAEVVADHIIPCGHGNAMIVRRCSLKFGNLTEHQRFMLECFIWVNAEAQC